MIETHEDIKIRKAKASDAGRISVLSGQLGYPTTPRKMSTRLNVLCTKKMAPALWPKPGKMESLAGCMSA